MGWFKKMRRKAASAVRTVAATAKKVIVTIVKVVAGGAIKSLKKILDFLKKAGKAISNIAKKAAKGMGRVARRALKPLKKITGKFENLINKFVGRVKNWIILYFRFQKYLLMGFGSIFMIPICCCISSLWSSSGIFFDFIGNMVYLLVSMLGMVGI